VKIRTFGALLGISVAASAGIGWKAGWQAAPLGWHGKVAKIVRGGGAEELRGAHDALVASGSIVATDRKQRARLEMDDGSVLVLDRDTEIELDPSPNTRVVHVKHGVVSADVAHKEGFPPAKILTEKGEVLVVGTELTVTATDDTTDVQVTRGSVRAKASGGKDVDVEAGQEALISARGVDVGPAALSGTGDLLGEKKLEEEEGSGGVGELRARRPGRSDDKDRALRIASHAVKVRIAGAMARTEIEETFANDSDDDLEGIYRFPVPADALVDRLALEVDGKLQDGAFVERTRAAKILKGAIANATPLVKPKEDIVWVPGPWHDPALLEWQQGGRFELRIFPIPKRGSRRIVLGYTQTVDASLGLRRYVYPLPASGAVRMDDFSVDAQIVGADASLPVHARGYDLVQSADRLSFHESGFVPRGDLSIQYALPNRSSELSAWGFDDGGQSFVAMAIRPKLPASAEARPRDWAIVVDSGRTMFGERFARASRVAVALAQTLDRRDRVTVLACDVECRRNSSGYVPAGAAGAKALSDFLAPLVPDGASDLAGAVRSASSLGDPSRELRVVLVSDGVASAGYKRASRLADEVRDALPKNAAVLAVPVGSDADDDTLAEIARGGGGVVVPYAPGARVEDVVFALAGAGAGALLRDATVELPQGLSDAAPKALSTMRVGGETYVVAKMTSNQAQGDVVLRGTAGGEAFEARYPIDVKATSDAGNAFVPRLFAAKRIRDLERDGSESARTEAIALSQKLAVPSKFTSLLVLESEAMFKAFGIDRETTAPRWTGESVAASDDVTTTTPVSAADETATSTPLLAEKHAVAQAPAFSGGGGGGTARGEATLGGDIEDAAKSPRARPWGGWRDRRGGRFMRRVFHREATVASFDGVDGADRLTTARAALAAAPDDRAKHRDLARALLRRGAQDELERVLADWQKRDPLDGDAIALRADLLSARGDRVAAARVLSGVAASADASRIDALAVGAERAGDDVLACALRVASAETSPEDVPRVARAVRCERLRGRAASADRWLVDSGARRAAVESAVSKLDDSTSVFGDIVLDASWSASADLDLAVIDPSGQRLGWLAGRGHVQDATSRSHEKLGVATSGAGTFLVEIARSSGNDVAPISGFVNVTAFGMSKRVLFVLTSGSARVARVDVRFVSELVPIDQPGIGVGIGVGSFDDSVARARVNAISLQQCSMQEGPFGSGNATVTFDPSGGVSNVALATPFSMGRAGACVRRALMTARVAPFAGSVRMVTRNFVIAP
jgi:hypothetical protein